MKIRRKVLPGYDSLANVLDKALEQMPSDTLLVEEYVARVREAMRAGDVSARAAHAWYLLHRDEIEAGALAGWTENYVRKDVFPWYTHPVDAMA